jgi:biotin transport system substrate-specific component
MSKKLKVKDIVYSALFATLTAVLGYITIPLPFSPIAITGQSLAVMLAGCVLTPIQAGLSMLTFLFMGIIGLPVFSGGRAGIGVIVDKSGGYFIGYLVGAVIISVLVRKSKSKTTMFLACLFGGIIVVHILGAAWLGYVTGMGIEKAIMVGSVPFLPGDLLKAVAAVAIGVRLNKNVRSYAHA